MNGATEHPEINSCAKLRLYTAFLAILMSPKNDLENVQGGEGSKRRRPQFLSMEAIERFPSNDGLKGVLPKNYARATLN